MKKSNKKNKIQNEKPKMSKLARTVLIISAAIVVLLAGGIITLNAYNYKPTVAFYGISERNHNAIIEVLQKTSERKRGNKKVWPYNIEILDSSYSLEKALKSPAKFLSEKKDSHGTFLSETKKARKPELIIMYRGKNAEFAVENALKKVPGFSQTILDGMTTSIKQTAYINAQNNISAVPLLIDNCELDVNRSFLNSHKIEEFKTLEEFENIISRNKIQEGSAAISANFSDSYNFINLFGAIVEATSGISSLQSASEKIWKISKSSAAGYNTYQNLISELSKEGAEFYEAIELLKRWQNKSLLPKNINQFTSKDVESFMQANLSVASFMTLSDHRKIAQKTIQKFSSFYIPSKNQQRIFTSPVIVAIANSRNKSISESVKLLANSMQSELCSRTGLAPVQANCSVIDIQADDVRYWVAASGKPFEGLAESAFKTSGSRNQFAEALKSFLN